MEEVSGPAVIVGLEANPRNEMDMENVVCRGVPTFARSARAGEQIAGPAEMYEARAFSHGLHYADIGAAPETKTVFDAVPLTAMPPPPPSDLCRCPRGTPG